MPSRSHVFARASRGCALASTLALLPAIGCVANSSNPRIELRAARFDDEHAALELDLFNPGGRNLTVTRLDYQLSHGESSFPVASSTWSGKLELPAKGHALLNFDAHFDSPPMEPESSLLHLAGDLSFVDKTGYLGLRRMDLTHTSFQSQIQATRSSH